MKRKSLTIVSIVSIIIISLLLLGLTYGYYLTTIEGNESAKSVEVVTGDSKVLYTDLSTNNTSEIIEPGFKTVKTFTVQNTGEVSATYSIYLVDVINDFNRTQDITYNLYKKQGTITDVTIETDLSSWTRVNEEVNKEFPTEMSVIASNETIQNPNEIYTYVLKVEYYNHPTENQNEDQGKTLAFKVNLRAEDSYTNPFSEGTLAYNIIENAISELTVTYNKTSFINPNLQDGTTYTIPAEQKNNVNERILTYTPDDYGISYYYRGNVEDNYVNFAEMCWRIVRIEGDGSIKLILEDQNSGCKNNDGNWNIPLSNEENAATIGNFGYTERTWNEWKQRFINYLNLDNNATNYQNSMAIAFMNFQNTRLKKYLEHLKSGDWCLSDKAYADSTLTTPLTGIEKLNLRNNPETYYFDSYIRLMQNIKQPTLKCNGTKMYKWQDNITDMYVGTLTADEVVFSGSGINDTNTYYLLNNYQIENELYWWTFSPEYFHRDFEGVLVVSYYGHLDLDESDIRDEKSFRPAVTLKSGITITDGNGTLDEPYIIG